MQKIIDPGIYELTDAQYQSDPCEEISLRSSYVAKLLERGKTPAHVAHEIPRLNPSFKRDEKRHFDIGKAAHALLLGRGAQYAVIHADDYRGKKARDDKEMAYATGKVPLLDDEAAQVRAMTGAARKQINALLEAETIPVDPFDVAYSEKVIVWRDKETNVLCRAMLDGLSISDDFLAEYKTDAQSASLDLFQWKARKLGYVTRLAFYRRGLEALQISYSPHIGIFVQEIFEPYLLAFHRVTDEMIMRADQDVTKAMKIWRRCLDKGFEGYSALGYDLDLTDREREQEYGAQAPRGSAHVMSEDIPDEAYSPVVLGKK